MRCHDAGLFQRADQVRPIVTADPSNFDDAVVDQVLQWYPPAEVMVDLQDEGIAAFEASLAKIPVPDGEEPIWALSEDYEAPVTLGRAAAELGLVEANLRARLDTDEAIRVQFGGFSGSTGTVDRAVFEFAARDTICGLGIGDTCDEAAFCGASSVPCLDGTACDDRGRCVVPTVP